jgi:hypothetical protein
MLSGLSAALQNENCMGHMQIVEEAEVSVAVAT